MISTNEVEITFNDTIKPFTIQGYDIYISIRDVNDVTRRINFAWSAALVSGNRKLRITLDLQTKIFGDQNEEIFVEIIEYKKFLSEFSGRYLNEEQRSLSAFLLAKAPRTTTKS